MKLLVSNIYWDGKEKDVGLAKDLMLNIGKKLREEYSIDNRYRVVQNDQFEFIPTEEKGIKKYLFTSLKENKIPLDPKGAMAKKLGRNYMVSHRLTEKQWNGVTDCIIKTFDNLKLNCDVTFLNGEEVIVLRSGKVNNHWSSPNKFTEEK